ncbi:zinc finger protein 239 [Drosophila santomea]|uniref:zinc finger protein 239 n=1 Tax=Drosophila santomea TaxID=129105 RepID=UPI001954D5EA|nr:zinc finger protein 239 [Drosophila santomea]
MSVIIAETQAANRDSTIWHQWCRLCSKDHPTNQNVFFREAKQNSWTSTMAMTIGKYFWVDIKREDELSNFLCAECFTLMDCLIEFSERVRKVQILFSKLQSLKPDPLMDYERIRGECGVTTDGWKHIMLGAVEANLLQNEDEFISGEQPIVCETVTSSRMEGEILMIPNLLVAEQCLQEKQEFLKEEHIVEEMQISGIEEEVLEEEVEDLAEEEVETVEEEIDTVGEGIEAVEEDVEPHDASDCLVEVDHMTEERYIEESQIIEESQVSDFNMETYEIVQHDPQKEPEETKDTAESMESNEDTQDDISPEHVTDEEDEIPEEPAMYKCNICKKQYKKPKAYKRHMEEVHNTVAEEIPQLECNQCKLRFPTVAQLHSHHRTHVRVKAKTDNSCPHCEKRFTTPGTLKRHIEGIHNQIKPYVCDLCGKSFNYITGLKDHKLVHTDECPFECPECKRRFKNNARLKIHLDTHSAEIYECTVCGLKLKTRRTFNKHKLVHSDTRQFKCEVCGSSFKRSKTLKAHLILHTGIRPYKCNFCGRDFANGSNCRSHKRQAHPKELAEEEARGVTRSTLLPMLDELTKASKLLKTPAGPSKVKGSRPNVPPKKQDNDNESPTKDTDGAILYELVEELDYS